ELLRGPEPHDADRAARGAGRGGGPARPPDRLTCPFPHSPHSPHSLQETEDVRRGPGALCAPGPFVTSRPAYGACGCRHRQAAAPPRPVMRRGSTRKPMPPAIIVAAPITRKVVSAAPVSASSSPLPWAEVAGASPVSVRAEEPCSWAAGPLPPAGVVPASSSPPLS